MKFSLVYYANLANFEALANSCMKNIKIWNDSPSDKQLDEITEVLDQGGIMVYPTDTLYAIGCDALNPRAVEKICRLKNINPEKSNLSIVCSDISMAADYSKIDNRAFRILKENTPGPFTFLFRALSSLPRAFKGRKMVGIRIPDSNLSRAIAERLGRPLLTTSIEFDDNDYAVNPDLIAEKYEPDTDLFVEGEEGDTEPSTIVDMTGDTPDIIRQGKGILAD